MSWSRAEDPCQENFSELANNNTILGGARERGVWGSGPLLKIIIDGVIKSSKGPPLLETQCASVGLKIRASPKKKKDF